MLKLINVLDPTIILDDYFEFILNQKENMIKLINEYGVPKLSEKLQCHRTTIERYKNEKIQISREKYKLIKDQEV